MDLLKEVYKTLTADSALLSALADGGKGVRADLTSYSGRYPVVVYQLISDVPALFGDDLEAGRRVTVQISIVTTDGADHALVSAVKKDLQAAGWIRESITRITDSGNRITAIRFIKVDTESEE